MRNKSNFIIAEVKLTYLLRTNKMRNLFYFIIILLGFRLLFDKIGQHYYQTI